MPRGGTVAQMPQWMRDNKYLYVWDEQGLCAGVASTGQKSSVTREGLQARVARVLPLSVVTHMSYLITWSLGCARVDAGPS